MRQFQVRIGINENVDNLVVDINGSNNLAGAGINMAARILNQADGNQILIGQTVYETLQQREKYMGKFETFPASGKHGLRFLVHQYIGDKQIGLNVAPPSNFVMAKPAEVKLTQEVAHYFAQTLVHKHALIEIVKAQDSTYWSSAAIVLLKLLAGDSNRVATTKEFDYPPDRRTYGSGENGFEDLYNYYANQNFWVLYYAERYIVEMLCKYLDCFEYSNHKYHYEFLSTKGKDKLGEEYPAIWKLFDLDKYV